MPDTVLAEPERAAPRYETLNQILWRRFRRHRLAYASLWILAGLVLVCFSVNVFSDAQGTVYFGLLHYTDSGKAEDIDNSFAGPSARHPFGTDEMGRDVLIRVLQGGRISLTVGLVAALCAALLGTVIGALAGYLGGWIDTVLMRVTDAMLSLPILALMILLAAIDFRKLHLAFLAQSTTGSLVKIMFVVIFFEWMGVARLVRGSVLSLRERDFVTAARALGGSSARILLFHLIPNCMAPIIVSTTLAIGGIILYESVLSFLGLGIMPPMSSWGNMLSHAQSDILRGYWWLAAFPGALIWITVTAFNFLGDGLRDALDPRFVSGGQR